MIEVREKDGGFTVVVSVGKGAMALLNDQERDRVKTELERVKVFGPTDAMVRLTKVVGIVAQAQEREKRASPNAHEITGAGGIASSEKVGGIK
jgi:hypothetical protein